MAITPRPRCSAGSCSSRFSAPRSLNEAVYCRFSNFSHSSAPVISDSVREGRQGVRDDLARQPLRGGLDVGRA